MRDRALEVRQLVEDPDGQVRGDQRDVHDREAARAQTVGERQHLPAPNGRRRRDDEVPVLDHDSTMCVRAARSLPRCRLPLPRDQGRDGALAAAAWQSASRSCSYGRAEHEEEL